MKVGIIGASGYSGEELVRLLSQHPDVELACVGSRTLGGKRVADVLPAVRAWVNKELIFSSSDVKELAASDIDLFFLALPHGVAHEYAATLLEAGKTVIDLSADFRLHSAELYEDYYNHPHPAPELLDSTPYVLPELMENDDWKSANLIACPGCYPTSILVPLVPLLRQNAISRKGIIANSYSGVSGAGKKAAEAFLYCERAESAKAYGLVKHRHLSEIEEQLSRAANQDIIVQFSPHLAPMRRGIHTTLTVPSIDDSNVQAILEEFYKDSPFVEVLPTGTFPDTRHVTGTNRVELSAIFDPRTENWIITSVEDNLVKGASGQAIQIMNLKHGFTETAGLV